MEVWKNVYLKEYHNFYKVSNLGRIKSIEKTVLFSDGRKRKYKEIIRKQHFNKKIGYYYVSLKVNGIVKTISVHTLVYKTFCDYKKGLVIDHKDNNQKNNKLSNLQQISFRKNLIKDKDSPNILFRKDYNKYMVYYWVNGKNNHIGYFKKHKDAVIALNNFKKKLNE